MNATITTYAIYLAITIPVTIWVARNLHKNGRVFLLSCFKENEELADSVNHLLLVGFYLVNLGFVTLYLKLDTIVVGTTGIFETLSTKVGVVLLILGLMHFFNMLILAKLRDRGIGAGPTAAPPALPAGPPREAWRAELRK